MIKKYGEDVIITSVNKRTTTVCFRNLGHKILSETWYNQKLSNKEEKQQRIVRTAAAMINIV